MFNEKFISNSSPRKILLLQGSPLLALKSEICVIAKSLDTFTSTSTLFSLLDSLNSEISSPGSAFTVILCLPKVAFHLMLISLSSPGIISSTGTLPISFSSASNKRLKDTFSEPLFVTFAVIFTISPSNSVCLSIDIFVTMISKSVCGGGSSSSVILSTPVIFSFCVIV